MLSPLFFNTALEILATMIKQKEIRHTDWKGRNKTVPFYEDLQDLVELTPKKDVLFIIADWNAKVGSQEILEQQASLALENKMKQDKD